MSVGRCNRSRDDRAALYHEGFASTILSTTYMKPTRSNLGDKLETVSYMMEEFSITMYAQFQLYTCKFCNYKPILMEVRRHAGLVQISTNPENQLHQPSCFKVMGAQSHGF